MTNYPKISIVIPTFNQGEYISQTIDSILDQNYPDLELIIIDGGSTDQTVGVIKKYADRLSHWVSEKDNGQSHAINKGLEKSSGDVFNWINSDDWMEPGSLETIGNTFKNEEVLALCGRMNIMDNDRVTAIWGPNRLTKDLNKNIGFSSNKQPCTFFRLNALRNIGKISESLHYSMDQDMWIRFQLINGISGIKQTQEILTNFRLHDASKTSDGGENFLNDMMEIFVRIAQMYGHDKYIRIFKSLQSEERLNYHFDLKKQQVVDGFKPKVAYNYFLLRYLEMKLSSDSREVAKKYHKMINPRYLKATDIKYYLKIGLKLKAGK